MIISDAVKDRDEIKQDGGPETNMSSGEGGGAEGQWVGRSMSCFSGVVRGVGAPPTVSLEPCTSTSQVLIG